MDHGVSGQAGQHTQDSPSAAYRSDRIVVPQRLITALGIENALRFAEQMRSNQTIRKTELKHGEYALTP